MLAAAALNVSGKPMQVLDLTPDSIWVDGAPVESLTWSHSPAVNFQKDSPVLLRSASLPQHETRAMLSKVEHWIAVVAGQKKSLRRAVEFRQLSEAYLPACGGTIAWTERPQGRIREVADAVSLFIAKRFS